MNPPNQEVESLLKRLVEDVQRYGDVSTESLSIFEEIVRKYTRHRIRQSMFLLLCMTVLFIGGSGTAIVLANLIVAGLKAL